MIVYSSKSTITQLVVGTKNQQAWYFGQKQGSSSTGVLRYETGLEGKEFESFYGFKSQSQEDDVLNLASLGLINYDRECLDLFLKYYRAKVNLERTQKAAEEGSISEDDEGLSGGAIIGIFVAVIIVITITLFSMARFKSLCFNDRCVFKCKRCCRKSKARMQHNWLTCKRKCRKCKNKKKGKRVRFTTPDEEADSQ